MRSILPLVARATACCGYGYSFDKLILFLCILLLWIPSATIDTNTGLLRPARSPHHDSPELFYDLRRHPNLRCTATLTCATPPHPTGTLTCVRRHPTCAATSNLRTATPTPHPNLHTATLTVREPD